MATDNFRSVVESRVEAWLESRIREVFRQTAISMFKRVNRDDFKFDSQTYNLNASIGIGVFKDGILTDWIDNPARPAMAKTMTYKGVVYEIDGQQSLNEALGAIDAKGLGKWVMILVAAVPYALSVELGLGNALSIGDKQGKGWWSEDVVPFIIAEFTRNAKTLIG